MEYGNLSERLAALFAEQVADNAILTDSLFYQAGYQYGPESGQDSEDKTAVIGGFRFNLSYVRSRCLRYNQSLLVELGIKNPNAARYYEFCLPNASYIIYIDEETWQGLQPDVRKRAKLAAFINFSEANPKSKFLPVYLHGKNGIPQCFHIICNLAPFCDKHFLLWPQYEGRTGLNQIYHSDMLYWIDDLFCQLEGTGYTLFFSAEDAGNSLKTFHFQILKLPLPVFDYLDRYYAHRAGFDLITTSTQAWPLDGIMARYDSSTKDAALAEFDLSIREWLSRDDSHSFNLLFRIKAASGIREAFFIFRKKGFTRFCRIKNTFGACEAGGHVIIEDREDFDNFPDESGPLELTRW
jgi:hypothetical protein